MSTSSIAKRHVRSANSLSAASYPTAKWSAVSLFAGCGGSDLGLRSAGIEVIWANEKNESACEFYEQVTGTTVVHPGDVQSVDTFPKSDILVGCYPCQGYSQGGRRQSSRDERNFLYREFDRALRQTRPLAFVVENVDGMRFEHNSDLLRNQLTRFRMAGYRVAWKVLDAKDYGLAQDRRRLIMVGIRSSENVRFVFPEPTHGDGLGRKRYRVLRDVIWKYRDAPADSYCQEPFHWYYLSRNRRRGWDEQSNCIVARSRHVGLHPDSPPLEKIGTDKWRFVHSDSRARRLSYVECALIQGFADPTAFAGQSLGLRYRAIGNAVPPPLFAAVASQLVQALSRGR